MKRIFAKPAEAPARYQRLSEALREYMSIKYEKPFLEWTTSEVAGGAWKEIRGTGQRFLQGRLEPFSPSATWSCLRATTHSPRRRRDSPKEIAIWSFVTGRSQRHARAGGRFVSEVSRSASLSGSGFSSSSPPLWALQAAQAAQDSGAGHALSARPRSSKTLGGEGTLTSRGSPRACSFFLYAGMILALARPALRSFLRPR